MFPYFLLILIPGVLSFVSVEKGVHGKRKVYIGTTQHVLSNSLALPAFFFMLFVMLSCRAVSVGNDTGSYQHFFEIYRQMDFRKLFGQELDLLYVLFCWLVGQFTNNYQVFLAGTAALSLYSIAKLYGENRQYSFLVLILFVNMSVFPLMFSGIRQGIAISMGAFAYRFVREKRPVLFLLIVVAAMMMHHSAFMLLPMYPLYHINFQRKHLWIIVPLIVLVFLRNQQIFTVLSVFLAQFSDKYDSAASQTGAYSMLIFFILLLLISYMLPGRSKLDRETMGLRNYLVMAVILQCFAPVHTLSMRLNYYYIVFIPVTIPKILEAAAPRYRQVAKVAVVALCAFFTLYYCRSIYNSAITGASALSTVPYVPFWES